MLFASDRIAGEYKILIPDLRVILVAFESYSSKNGLPEPYLTELFRYKKEQVSIYVRYWQSLVSRLAAGHNLSPTERQVAIEMRGKKNAELQALAEARFSWHMVACAADLRTIGPDPKNPYYSPAHFEMAKAWFSNHCRRPEWEFLSHDVHGQHFHIGRRDFDWKQKFINIPLRPAAGGANA